MEIMLWIIVGVFVNWIIGVIICSEIDTPKGHLLEWAEACPIPCGTFIVASFWPIILFFHFKGTLIK